MPSLPPGRRTRPHTPRQSHPAPHREAPPPRHPARRPPPARAGRMRARRRGRRSRRRSQPIAAAHGRDAAGGGRLLEGPQYSTDRGQQLDSNSPDAAGGVPGGGAGRRPRRGRGRRRAAPPPRAAAAATGCWTPAAGVLGSRLGDAPTVADTRDSLTPRAWTPPCWRLSAGPLFSIRRSPQTETGLQASLNCDALLLSSTSRRATST